MRIFLLWLLVSASLAAQQPAGRGAGPAPTYKNLKLLAASSDVPFIMRSFNEALGVQCTHCHLEGDFAAEGNPRKEMARKMISMVRIIDTSFPSGNGVFPDGYHEVDCLTCHRGSVKPETVAPRKYYNRGNSLGDGPFPQRPGISLKLLPRTRPYTVLIPSWVNSATPSVWIAPIAMAATDRRSSTSTRARTSRAR